MSERTIKEIRTTAAITIAGAAFGFWMNSAAAGLFVIFTLSALQDIWR